MKNKITLTIILTSLFVLLTGALTAHAACTGHLDGVSGDTISGWAWDPEDPQKEVSVTLTIKNAADSAVVRSLTVNACESFSHLADAGIGTGNYGFSANAALSALPDGVYLAEASGNGDRLPNALVLEKTGASVKTISASGVRSLGAFTTTAYCPCYTCSEGWGRSTSTGAVAAARHTIAVDPRVIPYGSRVLVGGVVYTAEDRGGGVKGNHIDIFFDTHAETRQYGTRTMEVLLLQ